MKWSEWKTDEQAGFRAPGINQYRETDEVECWVWFTFNEKPSKCFGKLRQWRTVVGAQEMSNDPYFVPTNERLGAGEPGAPPFGLTFQELIGKLIASKKRGIQANHRDNRRLREHIKALEQMEEPQ